MTERRRRLRKRKGLRPGVHPRTHGTAAPNECGAKIKIGAGAWPRSAAARPEHRFGCGRRFPQRAGRIVNGMGGALIVELMSRICRRRGGRRFCGCFQISKTARLVAGLEIIVSWIGAAVPVLIQVCSLVLRCLLLGVVRQPFRFASSPCISLASSANTSSIDNAAIAASAKATR